MLLFILIFLSISFVLTSSKTGNLISSTSIEGRNPFQILTNYLLRNDRKNKEFIKFSEKEIESIIKKLALGQKTMKSMDGASHMMNNVLTADKKSSLTARYKKFVELDLEQESKSMSKEATKVLEYVNTVERSMQACEILQCINEKNHEKRKQMLLHAGLNEMKRITLSYDKVIVTMSILLPIVSNDGRFAKGEMILAFVDACSIESILRMCTKPTESYELKSVGLLNEEVTLLPIILQLSIQGLEHVRELMIPAQLPIDDDTEEDKMKEENDNDRDIGSNNHKGMKKHSKSHAADKIKKKGGKHNQNKKKKGEAEVTQVKLSQTHSISGEILPQKVRTIGYSAGGAIASYVAMILDGLLSLEDFEQKINDMLGLYKDHVRCITIASPPCISRNIVPRYISSLICGDDIICRSHEQSLSYMKKRVLSSLKTSSSIVGKIPGTTFLSDMAAVTGKGMSSYTGNAHDLESAHVPGRVFFMKKRKHKNGVSFQRVLRGNWREDMLWTLRDILLSTRMFEHHNIESYINTLMRC